MKHQVTKIHVLVVSWNCIKDKGKPVPLGYIKFIILSYKSRLINYQEKRILDSIKLRITFIFIILNLLSKIVLIFFICIILCWFLDERISQKCFFYQNERFMKFYIFDDLCATRGGIIKQRHIFILHSVGDLEPGVSQSL